jgi:nucleotide-binding universal stress UspA family protein
MSEPASAERIAASARLEKICEELHARGVPATARILVGKPAREISREVKRNSHDIVIKTAQGDRKRKERAFFGTTGTALMRECPCPVWIAAPDQTGRCDRILAAIDPSIDDPARAKLNLEVLNLAADLAASAGASLHVINAWLPIGESHFRTHLSEDALRKYIKDSRRYAHRELAGLVARCKKWISPSNVHLVRGDRAEIIPAFASHCHSDLVVMGTFGRTGISGLVFGNTAEMVLRRVHCSVLTIQPDAFAISQTSREPVTVSA